MAAQTGATLADLMKRLGPSSMAAARRYLHAVDGQDRKIAKALSELAAHGDVARLPRQITMKHYALFRRWQRDGTWVRILTALQAAADAAGQIVWDVSVDSTTAPAHQHAAGARKKGIGRPNHPAGCVRNQPIMRWVAPVAG